MKGFGLANRALTELLQAPLEQMKEAQYFQLRLNQINLLLALGRLHEVADALPHLKKVLGPYQTHYQVLLAAATGNYALADQGLDEQIKNLTLEKRLADMASNYCRSMAPTVSGHGMVLANLTRLEIQNTAVVLLQKAAELYLVRGLLALEKGDVNLAAAYFQKTLDLVGTTVFFPDRPIAQRYLELIRKQK